MSCPNCSPIQSPKSLPKTKTVVVHHSGDYDGLFCREIAKKFLPVDAAVVFVGWDFGDDPIVMDPAAHYIVMDLPLDRTFGFKFKDDGMVELVNGDTCGQMPLDRVDWTNITWIDHHKSAIETHPNAIPGYRIDGVAACRLAWHWFQTGGSPWAKKYDFDDRRVIEPLAIRLAGEYDVFSPRMKEKPAIELFQCGLNGSKLLPIIWDALLTDIDNTTQAVINNGIAVKIARDQEYAGVIQQQGFDVRWNGINFLACNSHELDIRSQLFQAGIKPHHEALLGFTFTGHDWRVSLYQIEGKKHVDILSIAKALGGGGHPGACGVRLKKHPEFLLAVD